MNFSPIWVNEYTNEIKNFDIATDNVHESFTKITFSRSMPIIGAYASAYAKLVNYHPTVKTMIDMKSMIDTDVLETAIQYAKDWETHNGWCPDYILALVTLSELVC